MKCYIRLSKSQIKKRQTRSNIHKKPRRVSGMAEAAFLLADGLVWV